MSKLDIDALRRLNDELQDDQWSSETASDCANLVARQLPAILAALERGPQPENASTVEFLRERIQRIAKLAADARDERDQWRLRAERVEAALRRLVGAWPPPRAEFTAALIHARATLARATLARATLADIASTRPRETFDQWYERVHPPYEGEVPSSRIAFKALAEEGWNAALAAAPDDPQQPDGERMKPPADFWRPVPCGHPPDPVGWQNPEGLWACHCGSLLNPEEVLPTRPGGPKPLVACHKCGCVVLLAAAPSEEGGDG